MKLEKKLIIIGVISFVITLIMYFLDSDPNYPGFTGFLNSMFELGLMTFLIFLVISINFFAISFLVTRIARLFKS